MLKSAKRKSNHELTCGFFQSSGNVFESEMQISDRKWITIKFDWDPQAILHENTKSQACRSIFKKSSAYFGERHCGCENYMLLALNQSTLQDQYSKAEHIVFVYDFITDGVLSRFVCTVKTCIYICIIAFWFGSIWFHFISFRLCRSYLATHFSLSLLGNAFRNALISCAHVFIFVKKRDKRNHNENMPKPIFARKEILHWNMNGNKKCMHAANGHREQWY